HCGCTRNNFVLSIILTIRPTQIPQLVAGLAEIHKRGWIHRNIKCENVFLGEDNTIVIGKYLAHLFHPDKPGDFGFTSLNPTIIEKPSSEEVGDILFWAPEICKGNPINQKVDIWALGIVVLEIINFGKAPYEGDHLEKGELKRTIIEQGRPHYPQNMDTRLVDFVDRCLEPDCQQRASANELLEVGHIILCKHTLFIIFSGAIPNIQQAYGTDAVCLFDSVLLVHQPSIASCHPIAKSPYFRYDLVSNSPRWNANISQTSKCPFSRRKGRSPAPPRNRKSQPTTTSKRQILICGSMNMQIKEVVTKKQVH
ncbi:kinase-like domain-containing protein, partial [Jimgerdemannia flammicorona]